MKEEDEKTSLERAAAPPPMLKARRKEPADGLHWDYWKTFRETKAGKDKLRFFAARSVQASFFFSISLPMTPKDIWILAEKG